MTVLDSGGRFGSAGRAKRTRRLIAWGLVAALAAGGAWAVWFSTVLSVREVRVLGAVTISTNEVRNAAAVPVAQQLARVDVPGITRRVGSIPQVASVEIRRGWPDVLVIVVTERKPLAVARTSVGFTYLDRTGARFGAVTIAPRGVPVVVASSASALSSALAVVAALPSTLRATVTTVTARTYDDVVLALRSGVDVQWGSADDSDHKASVLTALLKVPAGFYDVSAPDLPTTRATRLG